MEIQRCQQPALEHPARIIQADGSILTKTKAYFIITVKYAFCIYVHRQRISALLHKQSQKKTDAERRQNIRCSASENKDNTARPAHASASGHAVLYYGKEQGSKPHTQLKSSFSVFIIAGTSYGLARWPFIPTSRAAPRSSSKAFAVTATIGIQAFFLSSSARICLVAS